MNLEYKPPKILKKYTIVNCKKHMKLQLFYFITKKL